MTPGEIRNEPPGSEVNQSYWLREIAAQLAELNESLKSLQQSADEINKFGVEVIK